MDREMDRHVREKDQPAGLGEGPLLCLVPTISQESRSPGQTASPQSLEHRTLPTWAPQDTILWELLGS